MLTTREWYRIMCDPEKAARIYARVEARDRFCREQSDVIYTTLDVALAYRRQLGMVDLEEA